MEVIKKQVVDNVEKHNKDTWILDNVTEIFIERTMLVQYNEAIEREIKSFLKENNYIEEKLFKIATQRQADSKYWTLLAFLNSQGLGAPIDDKNSFYWYCKAAVELHDPIGLQKTATSYYFGIGVEQNSVTANSWYKKAAEANMIDAQFRLARNYFHGDGIEVDHVKGLYWFEKSASLGSVDAMNLLARFYLGQLIYSKKDLRRGFIWSERLFHLHWNASRTGFVNLTNCFQRGWGTCVDMHKAIFVFVYMLRNGRTFNKRRLANCFRVYT
ncbi:11830_t:CDS:1 [Ambispora leptoticha]|uniref:11830_t:CDS:1 n=1 Tax=Ambispora leptoticha TaxID=144679 RepID=A0A9N8ZC57_9GLOM|nr:11830_t:CDS:1 [Ambispora leptoticha]